MKQGGIPAEVEQLLADHIDSVEQLETLLLLLGGGRSDWDAESVSGALYTSVESAADRLASLHAAGILDKDPGRPTYCYKPRTTALDRAVRSLAAIYPARRVTIISLIFSRPTDKIRSFADAFKFKRDEE